jgi:hypothetical protein
MRNDAKKELKKDSDTASEIRYTPVAEQLAAKAGLNWADMNATEQRAYKKEAEFNIKAKKKLKELNDSGIGLSDEDKKQKAIVEAGDLQDSERGALYQKTIEESGVPLYSSYLKLGQSAQKSGKAGRLLEQSTATVDDMLRAKEGKMGDRLIKFEDAQYQSDIETMDRMDYEEKVHLIKDTYNQTAALRAKAKTKDGLTRTEEKLLKNGVQNMSRVLASMYKTGDSEFLNEIIEDLDGSFKKIDLSNADNNHIRDIAFLTGASANDVYDIIGTDGQKEEELKKLQNGIYGD